MTRYDWMDQALCAQTDPDLFFPDNNRYTDADKICTACPVRAACADHVQRVEADTRPYGQWAGQSPTARRASYNRRQAANDTRRNHILRLHRAGWEAAAIADHVGCTDRTVWRTVQQYGEAA